MYIAIHADAERKPKAIRAAAALKLQPRQFIFQVMAPVWMFAAENHDGSGTVTGLDDDILSVITFGVCGSVKLLVDTGWLSLVDGHLSVPDWEDHEPYFAGRARDRQRKREERAGKSRGRPTDIPRTSVVEEKRVEERITENTSTTLPASKPPDAPEVPKPKARKPHWSEPAGAELAKLTGCPKNGPYPFLNKLSGQYTTAAVLEALADRPTFTNWAHAAGWLTEAAKRNAKPKYAEPEAWLDPIRD